MIYRSIFILSLLPSIQALRRITITRNEHSQPIGNQADLLERYPTQLFWPPAPPADYPPAPPPTEEPYVSIEQYQQRVYQAIPVPEFNTEELEGPETTTVRYLRKVKVQPRGGKNLKQTYQRLQPIAQQRVKTTTAAYTTAEPILEPAPEYTHEMIMDMCSNAYNMAKNFGIHNFDSHFAGANCGLIRMYYPSATCKEIENFMIYCDKHRARS